MKKNPLKRLSIITVCLTVLTFILYCLFAFGFMQPNILVWSDGQRGGFITASIFVWGIFLLILSLEDILDDIYDYFDC